MSTDIVKGLNGHAESEAEATFTALPPLELDVSEYLPEMDEFDMTEAQKIEMLQTLWAIMRGFVELGFSTKICGQILENLTDLAEGESVGVEYPSAPKTETPSKGNGKDGSA